MVIIVASLFFHDMLEDARSGPIELCPEELLGYDALSDTSSITTKGLFLGLLLLPSGLL